MPQSIEALRALARAVDAKDPSTFEHSERVAVLARALALEMGWDQRQANRLYLTGLVHDVGKIGVKDEVLFKVSRLTNEEFAHIRTHVGVGIATVRDTLDDDQVEWLATHHERVDGRGYPAGLHDEQIPEGGAIISLADSFDVMTSRRPYAEPRPVPDALLEVCRNCGRQFRHDVVRALENLTDGGRHAPVL